MSIALPKFEVTTEDYCAFLNGVARRDPHELYDPRMGGGDGGISRDGPSGNFSCSVKDGRARWPVNFVTVALTFPGQSLTTWREDLVHDDGDREAFVKLMSEWVQGTGWEMTMGSGLEEGKATGWTACEKNRKP